MARRAFALPTRRRVPDIAVGIGAHPGGKVSSRNPPGVCSWGARQAIAIPGSDGHHWRRPVLPRNRHRDGGLRGRTGEPKSWRMERRRFLDVTEPKVALGDAEHPEFAAAFGAV